jgi:hypothetical protein
MSLVAADNALTDGVMQRRFMRDRAMASFAELLQGRCRSAGSYCARRRATCRKSRREVPFSAGRSSARISIIKTLAVRSWETARIKSSRRRNGQTNPWDDITLTRTSPDPLGRIRGWPFLSKAARELVSLLPSPVFDPGVRLFRGAFRLQLPRRRKSGNLSAAAAVSVPEDEAASSELLSYVARPARCGARVLF